jgi:hypothetical protein
MPETVRRVRTTRDPARPQNPPDPRARTQKSTQAKEDWLTYSHYTCPEPFRTGPPQNHLSSQPLSPSSLARPTLNGPKFRLLHFHRSLACQCHHRNDDPEPKMGWGTCPPWGTGTQCRYRYTHQITPRRQHDPAALCIGRRKLRQCLRHWQRTPGPSSTSSTLSSKTSQDLCTQKTHGKIVR